MSQAQEGCHHGTVCDSRQGPCDTRRGSYRLPSGARAAVLFGATSARMEDLDGRVADVGVGGGSTEQCLQWTETATDRTTERVPNVGTRNGNRPSASRASVERARVPVANSTGISTTSPNTAAVVASACTATTVGTLSNCRSWARNGCGTAPQWCIAAQSADTSGPGHLGQQLSPLASPSARLRLRLRLRLRQHCCIQT